MFFFSFVTDREVDTQLKVRLQEKLTDGRRRTYLSGNSTGLVLILLCKANMFSSINGH